MRDRIEMSADGLLIVLKKYSFLKKKMAFPSSKQIRKQCYDVKH